MAAGLPLMESVLTPLAKCVLLPTDAAIQRIIFRSHYDNINIFRWRIGWYYENS